MPPDSFDRLRDKTPARLSVGRAGPRYTTSALLHFRADHARAVDAVLNEIPAKWAKQHGMTEVRSCASSREEYLLRPELGRRIVQADLGRVKRLRSNASRKGPTVLFCVGDGLSCAAAEAHAPALVNALTKNLRGRYRVLKPIFIRNARVRIQDHVGELARPDVIVMIVGERPGLATAESLSAYVIWRPRLRSLEPDRTVLSNIHPDGLPITEAAVTLGTLIDDVVTYRASGAALAEKRNASGASG